MKLFHQGILLNFSSCVCCWSSYFIKAFYWTFHLLFPADQVISSRHFIKLFIFCLLLIKLFHQDILLNFHLLFAADQVITSRHFIELFIFCWLLIKLLHQDTLLSFSSSISCWWSYFIKTFYWTFHLLFAADEVISSRHFIELFIFCLLLIKLFHLDILLNFSSSVCCWSSYFITTFY